MDMRVHNLAVRFIENLGIFLTDEQLAEAAARNKADPNVGMYGICHSHDFCDANQAMIDAVGSEFENSDEQNKLIAAAWEQARQWEFKIPCEKAPCKKCGESVDIEEMDYREWCEMCVYLEMCHPSTT